MFQAVLSTLTGAIAGIALVVHTLVLGTFLYCFIVLRWLIRPLRPFFDRALTGVANRWIGGILWWIRRMQPIRWDIRGIDRLNPNGWYLITANHQSWADIFVLFRMFHRRIPLPKFFIKKEMARVPVVGQAFWALDFPFMQRYSRAYLEQHPEKAGEDLEATRRACARFAQRPTSVMNFLEGTRFAPHKHDAQGSPYRHLLKPKTGGLAFTIQALGDRFTALTNVTIVYPKGAPTFWDLLCGRVREVIVRVQETPIPTDFLTGDYLNDPHFKQRMQCWVTDLWQEKDRLIDSLLDDDAKPSAAQTTGVQAQRSK